MKKTSLTTAVIAGIAGVAGISNMASAIFLNPDGLGSVLIYPYYTVKGDNTTLLSVVNTTDQGKAVKVRFLEAYNSKEVLDFNLYLSPHDVWTSEVIPVGSGAGVHTPDNSCTVPAIGTATIAFRNFEYATRTPDGGPTGIERTREGYVELIEMGEVQDLTQDSLSALTHDATGVPADCGQLEDAWANGYWLANRQVDMTAPRGGLFGSAAIINVGQGTIAGYNADAIDQFYSTTTTLSQHSAPGDLLPSMNSATSLTSYVFEEGRLATSTFTNGVDAVTSLFMVQNIYNEFVVSAGLGASTEWVVTFPTKRFYVDTWEQDVPNESPALPPFDTVFDDTPETPDGTSCSPVSLQFWNQEELTTSSGVDFSPQPTAAGTALCWEAQVVTFNQGSNTSSNILGSTLIANIDVSAVGNGAGWALIDFTTGDGGISTTDTHRLIANNGNTFFGLPATGFAVQEFVNNTLTDAAGTSVLANYTGLYRHRFNRSCVNATTGICS